MTVEYFTALESRIPAEEARRMMHAAEAAFYPHVTKEGARRMWRHWSETVNPTPIALPVKGALLSFNGQAVDFPTLREQLSGALGRGLVA